MTKHSAAIANRLVFKYCFFILSLSFTEIYEGTTLLIGYRNVANIFPINVEENDIVTAVPPIIGNKINLSK